MSKVGEPGGGSLERQSRKEAMSADPLSKLIAIADAAVEAKKMNLMQLGCNCEWYGPNNGGRCPACKLMDALKAVDPTL